MNTLSKELFTQKPKNKYQARPLLQHKITQIFRRAEESGRKAGTHWMELAATELNTTKDKLLFKKAKRRGKK